MHRDTSNIGRRLWAPPLVGWTLAALLVSAAGPAFAQTETSTSATTPAPEAKAEPAPAAPAEPVAEEPASEPAPAAAEPAPVEAAPAAETAPPPAPEAKAAEPTGEPEAKAEPTPAEPAKKAGPEAKAKGEDAKATSGDQAKNVLVRNIADAPVGRRDWFLSGTLAYRTLVVNDQDPANDMSLDWILQAGHKIGDGVTAFAQLRLQQRFVAEEDDSPFRFQDVQAGVNYIHRVSLVDMGIDRKIAFFHRFAARFPTSRASQRQDLILAPRLISRGRVNVIGDLYFGFTGLVEYRWHEFAEQAGLQGGMNTQAVLAAQGAFEYNLFQSKDWGVLVLGVDAYGGANFEYANRDGDRATLPFFGWDLYAQYVPMAQLAVGVSLEQGEPVFQSGAWRVQFFDRERTQVAVSITGRY